MIVSHVISLTSYIDKDVIFKQGNPAKYFYVIYQGRVTLEDCHTKRSKLKRSGDFFGHKVRALCNLICRGVLNLA